MHTTTFNNVMFLIDQVLDFLQDFGSGVLGIDAFYPAKVFNQSLVESLFSELRGMATNGKIDASLPAQTYDDFIVALDMSTNFTNNALQRSDYKKILGQ